MSLSLAITIVTTGKKLPQADSFPFAFLSKANGNTSSLCELCASAVISIK
jgi:hypothetical protein